MSGADLPALSIVTNYAAFRRIATVPSPSRAGFFVRGRQGYGDAGMAMFGWDPDSVAADDDATVLRPNDRTTTAGRWVKVTVGEEIILDPLQLAAVYGVTLLRWVRSDLGVTLNTQPTLTAPNDFTNAAWTKASVTAPSANRIVEVAASAVHRVGQLPGSAATEISTVTFDVEHGAGSINRDYVYIEGNGGSMRCFFNISTGALGTQTGGTATITDLGAGRFRCQVVFVNTTGQATFLGISTDGSTLSYLGDVNADFNVFNATFVQIDSVAGLADQSGAGNHYVNRASARGPIFGTPVDGAPELLFNDPTTPIANTVLRGLDAATPVMPAPGTTKTWHSKVTTLKTWTSGRSMWSSITGFIREVFLSTSTPQIRTFNGSNGALNGALTIGVPARVEEMYDNTVGSYLKAGAVTLAAATGNSSGGGGMRLGGDSGANGCHEGVCEEVLVQGEPPQGFKAGIDLYFETRYPSAQIKTAGLPVGSADSFLCMGTSNMGNSNTQADPTGIADETDVRVLSPYNATSLITTLTPLPNVGIHVRLVNRVKAAGRRPAVLRHFSNGSIITNWQKGFTLGDQHRMGISNLKAWLVGDFNPLKTSIPIIGWENDGTIEANANAVEGILRGIANDLSAEYGYLQIHCGISPDLTAVPFRDIINTAIQTVVNESPSDRIYVSLDTVVGAANVSSSDHLHYLAPGQALIADLIWAAHLSRLG